LQTVRVIVAIALACGAGVGLLWGCGLLLARPLLTWRQRPFTLLLAPFLGLGLISSLAHYLGAAGFPLRRTAWLFAALAAAGWVTALWRPPRRPPREVLAALAIALLAFGFAVTPLVRLGYVTTVGITTDALSYVARSEYFQDSALTLPRLVPGFPRLAWVHSQFFLRVGDVYLLGLLGLLTGHRTYQLMTVLAALFFALASCATFAWARGTLRLPRDAALGAALLVALSNLLLWAVYGAFLSQAVAAAMVLPVVGSGIELGRRPGWRSAALFGLLAATLASIYACYAAIFVVLDWAFEWVSGRVGRQRAPVGIARRLTWGLAAIGLALAWNGVAVARSVPEMRFLTQLSRPAGIEVVGRGDIRVCPSPAEILGLAAHAGKVYGALSYDLPKPVLAACGLLLCGFVLYGWSRLGTRQRTAAAVVLLASAGFAAWQRWGLDQPRGYAYGYYKTVSIVSLALLPLVAAGLAAACRRRAWRWLALPLALLLVILNVRQIAWTTGYAFDEVLVDDELITAAHAAAAVPRNAWVWIDVARTLRQNWLAYLIDRQPLVFRDDIFMFSPGPLDPSAQTSYGLLERGLDERARDEINEPWYDDATSTPLWNGGRYELRRRTAATLATWRWASALWPPAGSLELAPGNGHGEPLEARFAGAARRLPLVPGRPGSIQLLVFSAAPAADLAVDGTGPPLRLAAGGYRVELDLGCLPDRSRIAFRHGAGTLFLRRCQVLGAGARTGRGCLDATPVDAGMGYVSQRLVALDKVRYDVTLVPPRNAGERRYRLGFHVAEPRTAHYYGVWSLDFPPRLRAQQAWLQLDLGNRSAQAGADGLAMPVDVSNLTADHGSFESDEVWWQFNPVKQLFVEPILWFSRFDRSLAVTRVAAGDRMTILEAP
jgi:hypothetical protein